MWQCYQVLTTGESLNALASSATTLRRSPAGIGTTIEANARTLYNETDNLYAGMYVRLPIAPCVPSKDEPSERLLRGVRRREHHRRRLSGNIFWSYTL